MSNFMVPKSFSSASLEVNMMPLFHPILFFPLTVIHNVDVDPSGIRQDSEHVKALAFMKAELPLWEPWGTSADQMGP